MSLSRFFPLFLFLSLFISLSYSATAKKHNTSYPASDLVRSSCTHATYPTLCLRTLSTYSSPATTPRDLALASVNVSLAGARRVHSYLSRAGSDSSLKAGSKRQRAALSDCVDQISESVDELSETLLELRHLRVESFQWQMSNVETWVSAALTNEDTCLDGFQDVDGKVKSDVKRRITNVAKVTSNALYMINQLDESRGKP